MGVSILIVKTAEVPVIIIKEGVHHIIEIITKYQVILIIQIKKVIADQEKMNIKEDILQNILKIEANIIKINRHTIGILIKEIKVDQDLVAMEIKKKGMEKMVKRV